VERADVAAKARREKANLEDAARRARYGFFAKLVEDGHVTRVAVAHTADDQAETVLAHILRGTGLAGLGAIHPVAGHVVRPLLAVRRAELRAYLKLCKQSWREDASNRDVTKMRARIRKKLLPVLVKHFQPAIVEHLATLVELAREDEAFLDLLTEERAAAILRRDAGTASVSVKDLLTVPAPRELTTERSERKNEKTKALAKRLVRRVVKELKPRSGQLNAIHVEAVLALAEHGENGKCVPLPGGVVVQRERDRLVFLSSVRNAERKQSKQYEHIVDLAEGRAVVPVPYLGCVFRFTVIDWPAKRGETSGTGPVLDRDRLRVPFVLRNWRPGDKLQLPGHRHAHKLKRLLNERGISRWERDGWPVLTSSGVLAWARGFPVAAEFAASERTRAAIVMGQEPLS
jgi:tRNA(Ile)-lysidine synthase